MQKYLWLFKVQLSLNDYGKKSKNRFQKFLRLWRLNHLTGQFSTNLEIKDLIFSSYIPAQCTWIQAKISMGHDRGYR